MAVCQVGKLRHGASTKGRVPRACNGERCQAVGAGGDGWLLPIGSAPLQQHPCSPRRWGHWGPWEGDTKPP